MSSLEEDAQEAMMRRIVAEELQTQEGTGSFWMPETTISEVLLNDHIIVPLKKDLRDELIKKEPIKFEFEEEEPELRLDMRKKGGRDDT